jgi:hypothetical protein
MSKRTTSLGRVQKLASQLSREDRLTLFDYLAKLPDSGLIYHPPVLEPTSLVLPSNPTQEILALNVKMGWSMTSDGRHVFSVEDREVLSIKFDATNYAEFGFQQLKDKALHLNAAGEGHDLLQETIRADYQNKGIALTQEQVDQIERKALDWYAQTLLKDSLEKLAATIDQNINQAGMAVLAKIIQIAGFNVVNLLRDTLRMKDKKLKVTDVHNILYKPEWERLKTIVGLRTTQGGARNVKHDWTPDELECLAKNYQELQPIWREAKQIARAAQKSPVASRRNNWQAEVLRAYPDLPNDLLNHFKHVRADDAKPSDIALIHAKTKCGVIETYTPRELSDKIRSWNLKKTNRNSSKSSKTRKFKTRG